MTSPHESPTAAALRGPALLWSIVHGFAAAALFAGPLAASIRALPLRFAAAMWPAFAVEAFTLSLVLFVLTVPASVRPRVYAVAVPLTSAIAVVALAIDAVVYRLVGFHVNGFFLRVLVQPGALHETGVPVWQVAAVGVLAMTLVVVEVSLFPRFARALRGRPRRVWTLALALLVAGAGERLATAALSWWGGPGVFAASQVMPLQVPLRMNAVLAKLTGHVSEALPDPFSGAAKDAAARLPAGLAPSQVHFTRTPDVVFVAIESLRADLADERTMPRLIARARDGARFDRHYATAPATFYAVFSLLFGLEAHKTDAVLGAGRRPLLFGALKENGYETHLVTASGVEWMGMKDGVFGDVRDDLETDWPGPFATRDDELIRRARAWVERADPRRPEFLFLFFFGTHFDYFYPERSAVFSPAWDGKGSVKATTEPPEHIKNRARNAAHEVDWKLDEFLSWYEAKRGRRPLVIVTGDHGEEFREHGRIGHGSDVTEQQIHVPLVMVGDGVPTGRFDAPTSHVDLVPTLFQLLGDTHTPASYSDGTSLFSAAKDRIVLSTVGWEPTYAAIGSDVKVRFAAVDGFGRVQITDPHDVPLPDGAARFPTLAPRILKLLGRDPSHAPLAERARK